MQRLLIVDRSEEVCNNITYYLKGEFEVHHCYDGETALEQLQQLRPDALLTNIMLPYKDALTLLQESSYVPPVVLAWSYFVDAWVMERAISLGVSMVLIMPTAQTVVLWLMDLLYNREEEEEELEPRKKIALLLHLLRFPPHLDGHQQLSAGIKLFYEDPRQNLQKELYPAVAKICDGKTTKSVEHSIRKAINRAWNDRVPGMWEKYFSNTDRCPTNKMFIARMAQLLEEEIYI